MNNRRFPKQSEINLAEAGSRILCAAEFVCTQYIIEDFANKRMEMIYFVELVQDKTLNRCLYIISNELKVNGFYAFRDSFQLNLAVSTCLLNLKKYFQGKANKEMNK